MLEKKTAVSGPTNGGKAKAVKATRTTAPMASRAAGKAAAPRPPKQTVQERIQRRAYELWETEGRPEGRQHAHWYQAEMEITRAHSQRVGASR